MPPTAVGPMIWGHSLVLPFSRSSSSYFSSAWQGLFTRHPWRSLYSEIVSRGLPSLKDTRCEQSPDGMQRVGPGSGPCKRLLGNFWNRMVGCWLRAILDKEQRRPHSTLPGYDTMRDLEGFLRWEIKSLGCSPTSTDTLAQYFSIFFLAMASFYLVFFLWASLLSYGLDF